MSTYLLPNDGSSQIVLFDLMMSEGHESTADVTEHPVEIGSNIADHVRPNPRTLNLEMYVTNTPVKDIGRGSSERQELEIPRWEPPKSATPGSFFRSLKGLISGPPAPVTIRVLTFPDVFDRVKEVNTTLQDLLSRGVDMSVVTSLGTYENMVLTSVSVPRTEKGGATFGLSVKQVRIVTTATVAAPKPKEKRGAPNQAKGGQATKPVGGKDAAKTTSMAVKALKALGID